MGQPVPKPPRSRFYLGFRLTEEEYAVARAGLFLEEEEEEEASALLKDSIKDKHQGELVGESDAQ